MPTPAAVPMGSPAAALAPDGRGLPRAPVADGAHDPHRHQDLPLQAPPRKRKAVALEVPAIVRAKRSSPGKDDSMIGTATFVILIAATAIADNAYPPCTQQRTDNCSAQQQAPGPTLYIPCPKGQYCPPHDIPRHKSQR